MARERSDFIRLEDVSDVSHQLPGIERVLQCGRAIVLHADLLNLVGVPATWTITWPLSLYAARHQGGTPHVKGA